MTHLERVIHPLTDMGMAGERPELVKSAHQHKSLNFAHTKRTREEKPINLFGAHSSFLDMHTPEI